MKKIYITLIFCFLSGLAISQVIQSVNPGTGTQGQTLTVSISGQNTHFGQGTGTTNVWFEQGSSTIIQATSNNILGATQVNSLFTLPYSAPSGWYNTRVSNSIDGIVTGYSTFYIAPGPNPPSIVSIIPNQATQGETLTVSISGQNTHFSQVTGTSAVWFRQGTGTLIFPDNLNVLSDLQLIAQFTFLYTHPTGMYDTHTYDAADGALAKFNSFELLQGMNSPYVDFIMPDTVYAGYQASLSIHGVNTHFQTGANLFVYFSSVSASFGGNVVNLASNTQMTFNAFPGISLPAGWYDMYLYNSLDGQIVNNHAVYVDFYPIGIKELSPRKGIHIYPNPGNGLFYLEFEKTPDISTEIEIYDVTGRFLRNVPSVIDKNVIPMDLTDLNHGLYFVRLKTSTGSSLIKLILE